MVNEICEYMKYKLMIETSIKSHVNEKKSEKVGKWIGCCNFLSGFTCHLLLLHAGSQRLRYFTLDSSHGIKDCVKPIFIRYEGKNSSCHFIQTSDFTELRGNRKR